MGSSRQTTTQQSTTSPWRPQAASLQFAFNEAGNLYNANRGTPGYTGDFTAGMNDTQRQALANMLSASGTFNTLSQNFGNTAQALSGSYQGAANVANNLASGDPVAQALAAEAQRDPTNSLINNAMQYANNPAIDGMVDAASRDVVRNLTESQLPSLNLAATGSGNINSSRTGAAEAIMARGAQDRIADVSAGLRGDAFNQGLAMAANQRQAMFANALTASGQNLNTQATGANALAQLGGVGTNLGVTAAELGLRPAQIQGAVGDAQQAESQRALDEARMRQEYNEARPWDNLSRYMGVVGANNWGQESTQTTTQQSRQNPFQTALGAAATFGGLAMMPFGGPMMGATLGGAAMRGLGGLFGPSGGGGSFMPLPATGGISQNPFGF